jgi:hypothetical protein
MQLQNLIYILGAVGVVDARVWVTVNAPASDEFLYGKASLAGPKSDLIVGAYGNKMLHHNITTSASRIIDLKSNSVYSTWGPKGSSIVYAVGEGIMQIDLSKPGATWNPVSLPFTLSRTFRSIHGTSPTNVWAVAGSGEAPPFKTSAIVRFDGKTWTKYLENVYNSAQAVFARGNQVWVGCGDGMIIYSSDNFATHQVLAPSVRGDTNIGQIWGGSSSNAPVFIAGPDGLKVIRNPNCTPKKDFFGRIKPCQVISVLGNAPDRGNTGYSIQTVVGEIPGMRPDQAFTAGVLGWGGLWDGSKLVQDKDMPVFPAPQSTYTSLIVGQVGAQTNLYAVGINYFITKTRLV